MFLKILSILIIRVWFRDDRSENTRPGYCVKNRYYDRDAQQSKIQLVNRRPVGGSEVVIMVCILFLISSQLFWRGFGNRSQQKLFVEKKNYKIILVQPRAGSWRRVCFCIRWLIYNDFQTFKTRNVWPIVVVNVDLGPWRLVGSTRQGSEPRFTGTTP